MDPRQYRFASSFTLGAPRSRVHQVLVDLERYSEWWPQVRAVGKLDDDHALVVCRSALPYDLELVLGAQRRDLDRLEVSITGPIRGWARFHLDEPGPGPDRPGAQSPASQSPDTQSSDTRPPGSGRTVLRFEQEVRAEARLFALASYVARPALVWNHDRMVAGLRSGLTRRVQPSAAIAAS